MNWRVQLQEGTEPVCEVNGERVLVGNPRVIWGELSRVDWGERISEDDLFHSLSERLEANRIDQESLRKYLRIACEASWEDLLRGAQRHEVAPFWRILDTESDLSKSMSIDQDWIKERQKRESTNDPLERAMWVLRLEWPSDEEVGNDPVELLLDILVSHELMDYFMDTKQFRQDRRSLLTCCVIFAGKPWWGVIRDLCFASDFPAELEFPMYDEFEETRINGFDFAEIIAKRIGKPFERINPAKQPIPFEVWDFREVAA